MGSSPTCDLPFPSPQPLSLWAQVVFSTGHDDFVLLSFPALNVGEFTFFNFPHFVCFDGKQAAGFQFEDHAWEEFGMKVQVVDDEWESIKAVLGILISFKRATQQRHFLSVLSIVIKKLFSDGVIAI
jgi:hypothetical protein